MNGPEFEPYDSEELLHTGRLVPVYPLTEGLTKRVVRKIVNDAVERFADLVDDALPDDNPRARRACSPLAEALRQVHFPDELGRAERARRRLAFDEFFLIQLGMLQRKQHWQHDQPGLAFGDHAPDTGQLPRAPCPSSLTGAQSRVVGEILERHGPAAADGPPDPGRCRLGQDGGGRHRAARRHRRRRAGRARWPPPRSWPSSTIAA